MNPTGSTYFALENAALKEQIAALKLLCARAADALEESMRRPADWNLLIVDLRKAAQ